MLTRKQEGFARDVAAGKAQNKAYCDNYNTKTDNQNVIDVEAHRVAANPKVALRVSEHVQEAIEASIPNDQIAEYVKGTFINVIETGKNEGAKVQAAMHLGKHIGMFREVIEAMETTMPTGDLISALAGDNAALKAQLLARFAPDNDAETTH